MSLNEFTQIDVEDISQLSQTVKAMRASDVPTIILGPPGIGKSDGIMQSLDPGDRFFDVRASQFDPIDVRGVPVQENVYKKAAERLGYFQQKAAFLRAEIERLEHEYARTNNPAVVQTIDGLSRQATQAREQAMALFTDVERLEQMKVESRVIWSRPEFWPVDGRGIIVLEEVNTAAPSVQNTLLQPLGCPPGQDRYVGAHRIPKEYYWCATGNRKSDFAHVVPLSTAFRNRVNIINIDQPNLNGWVNWAFQSDVHPYVIGFIKFKTDMLYQPPNKNDENVGFPTPRSWARQISPLVKAGLASTNLFKGAVGLSAATEFMAYVEELKDMPDLDAILQGRVPFEPAKYRGKMSIIYAVVTTLVTRCQANTRLIKPSMERVIELVNPEHGAIFVSALLRCDNKQVKADVVASDEVVAWAMKHKTLIEKETK